MVFDVIVIGGGITGAGILRDCALRGLKALLLERGEPGAATTAASTHLIHGGLRYLLYDRLTTHITCWDSGNIFRIARPLLTRLPILWPVYRDHRHGIETVETLLESYDKFSPMKEGLPHLRLSARETLCIVPDLNPEGLVGAVSFDEWWVDPVRLVRANLDAARSLGAEVRTGCQATGFLCETAASQQPLDAALPRDNARSPAFNKVIGAAAVGADGKVENFRGKIVLNASGPWVDRVTSLAAARVPLQLRKGTHLVYDRELAWAKNAPAAVCRPLGLLLEAEDRERYVFVVSAGGQTLLGPTDVPGPEDPDKISSSPEEMRSLLASVRRYFDYFPERFDRTIVGARPILGQRGSEKLLSREYEIIDHAARDGIEGLVTAAGGKMSDFRLMAQEAVDIACRKIGVNSPCRTADQTLAGEPLPPAKTWPRPPKPLKKLLRRHPRLREMHALAYLAGGLLRHGILGFLGRHIKSNAQEFEKHYNT
ncbi:MAG: FAD-dependent oxidoreductase [Elusimicrobia bacterium]|nr:FAD-dependent oxidoreductase [Elusimicrobiota bacterium]